MIYKPGKSIGGPIPGVTPHVDRPKSDARRGERAVQGAAMKNTGEPGPVTVRCG